MSRLLRHRIPSSSRVGNIIFDCISYDNCYDIVLLFVSLYLNMVAIKLLLLLLVSFSRGFCKKIFNPFSSTLSSVVGFSKFLILLFI